LRRRRFGKAEVDEEAWFLDDPNRSVNIEGGQRRYKM
jgi:hypothetical protein